MIRVGVVDYGMGNLHSVAKAIALQGGRVVVSDNRRKLKGVDLLVLPGVGAFGAAMKILGQKKLDDFVRDWILLKKPYLGICLGFQLLFERSEENPRVPGLGVFKGDVVKFHFSGPKRRRLPVPHMGWNTVLPKGRPVQTYLKGLASTDRFYFVHSFFPEPDDRDLSGTTTLYGRSFCSSVATPTLFASQFHPEKSGAVGLKVLKNILKAVPRS